MDRWQFGCWVFVVVFQFSFCEDCHYVDCRPYAQYRMDARDDGIVLRYGDGPQQCDILGARDVWVYALDENTWVMNYDGAGITGWLASQAICTNHSLKNWTKTGPILSLGSQGQPDSASASYGTTFFDQSEQQWHMFYLGTPHATPPPDKIPAFPYLTMKAIGASGKGPWKKQYDVVPFRPEPNTYYNVTASPGFIIVNPYSVKQTGYGKYLQFFSASTLINGIVNRTISVAWTDNLNGKWTINSTPLLPLSEQIENTSLYFEETNGYWFMFTNHVGINSERLEFTDAVWVYWTRNLFQWSSDNKAIVIDGNNCKWSFACIGLPSVIRVGNRLAIFYDGPGNDSISHMQRNVGLAWLSLPLVPPSRNT